MKAYKVLHKETRRGANAAIYIAMNSKGALEQAISRDNLHEYYPVYLPMSKVRKAPRSCGIMAFETLEDAEEYLLSLSDIIYPDEVIIVEVRGKKSRNQNRKIIAGLGFCPWDVKRLNADTNPPAGTVFFDHLEVLE